MWAWPPRISARSQMFHGFASYFASCRALHAVADQSNDAEFCQFIEDKLLQEQVGAAGGPGHATHEDVFVQANVTLRTYSSRLCSGIVSSTRRAVSDDCAAPCGIFGHSGAPDTLQNALYRVFRNSPCLLLRCWLATQHALCCPVFCVL